jgi:hypothetical protein
LGEATHPLGRSHPRSGPLRGCGEADRFRGADSKELSLGLCPRANAPKASNNFKKYILYFKKKTWYTDKAAPIPGGNQKLSTGFVRKEKFYKKIFIAYILFKTY